MKLAILFSGGKDSFYSLYWARIKNHEISCLISLISERQDSWMFHTPNIELAKEQAKALDLPIIALKTSGVKEKELADLKKAVSMAKESYNIKGVAAGALASKYQKERMENVCNDLNLKFLAPLWQRYPENYMNELIEAKFEVIITAVAAEGFNKEWLGRKIDKKCLEDLKKLNKKFRVHIAGEGGEYETFVLDGPGFKKKLIIKQAEKRMESECCGVYKIKEVELIDKD